MVRKGSKNKFDVDLGYTHIYSFYKKESTKVLDKTKYNKVFTQIFENLMNLVIEDGFNLQFPNKFGNLEIQKKKQKIVYNENGSVNRICFKIDWGETKKHWKTVYGDLSEEELKTIPNKPRIYFKNK